MSGKKGSKKKTMRIVLVKDTRTVRFVVSFDANGQAQTKTFESRADLFSWVRGAEMFGISAKSIVRTVGQNVTVERAA